MILTALLVLFFLVVIYLLLTPIVLCIDTATNQYYIQLYGIGKASIHEDEKELLKVKLRLFFLNFYFYPFKARVLDKKNKVRKKKAKKRKNRISFRTAIRMLRSFKVKKIVLDIDTGNYISNAKLFPVFQFLRYTTKGNFNINFEGRNQLALYIKNRPIDLIKSFVNF